MFDTLIDALADCVQQQPDKGILFIQNAHQEQFCSYPHLRQHALGVLHILQKKGVKEGDELILLLNDNRAFLDAFWGALHGGIVPVSVATGHSDIHRQKVFSIFQQLQSPWLYTSRKILNRLSVFAKEQGLTDTFARIQQRVLLIEDIDSLEQAGQAALIQPNSLAFIQYSSGSTGQPKGVMLSHANLLSNIKAIAQASQTQQHDSNFSWMPLTHDMGMIGGHLLAIVAQMSSGLMSTELFVRRPLLWLQKAAEHRFTLLSSPNFGYQHYLRQFKPESLEGQDLSAIRLIFNGAEPINPAICSRFMQTLADFGLSQLSMYPSYGLAEASLAVSLPPPQRALHILSLNRHKLILGEAIKPVAADDRNALSLVSVGQVVAECEIQLNDMTGLAVDEGIVGQLFIRGKNVTSGYYLNPTATQAVQHNGWLDTGDLAVLQADELYITGRLKELIIVNGQNYYPHDLEALLFQHGGMTSGKVAVCGVRHATDETDQLVVFVIHKAKDTDFATTVNNIRQVINQHAGLVVEQVLPITQLPKTTSGKIQRHALGMAYLNGDFEAVLQQQKKAPIEEKIQISQLEAELKQICAEVISDKSFTVKDNLMELGLSSLALAQIHEVVDSRYPDSLALTDFFDYPNIEQLAAHLAKKIVAID